MIPQRFVAKWRSSQLKERSSAQEHFIDICRLVGHPSPAEYDSIGETFSFEKGAQKQEGGKGWADVWFKEHFSWEYKGKHANLDKAYDQLLKYRESLQNPPLLIVSDINRIIIHTNFTNTVKQVFELSLDDLLIPEKLNILRNVFFNVEQLRAPQTTEQITLATAKEFSNLADHLRKWGESPPQVSKFLIRLLFCLFAEDVDLLPKNLFTQIITLTRHRTKEFSARIQQLFSIMSTGGWFGEHEILYFNGGLFADDTVLDLDSDALDILYRVSSLDWSNIEPSILGTLFERSFDPSKRSQLGAHYTSKSDILLMVEPVLMKPLRREWAQIKHDVDELVEKRDNALGRQYKRLQKKLTSLLTEFAYKISQIRVLDPACGSGNFLYVALRQLLGLEKEVIILANIVGVGNIIPTVSPAQLYGIELNSYAYELSQATVWIGYIQWLRENGFGSPTPPILKSLNNIQHVDAILAHDEEGNLIEPIWPQTDIILGNPPFIGDKKLRRELGNEYVEQLRQLYLDRISGQSDLVCYWFEKARVLVEEGKVSRVGLLATQAIRGGANRVVLERIKETGDIFWAQSDRDWVLEGANVHVSMVGFDNGTEKERELDGQVVLKINADLTSGIDVTQAEQLIENQNLSFIGTQKGGAFDLSPKLARAMLTDNGNPDNRPNSDVVKHWVNGSDITGRSRNMWIIDFGTDMTMSEAAMYEKPFEYVKEMVKPHREKTESENRSTKLWWLHQRPRPEMRKAFQGLSRYIVTPRVAKYRIFAWQHIEVLPDSAVVVIARDDDYFLGVLHSKIHEIWSLKKGTQLREIQSGFRYSQTMTFSTFPFPWSPGQEPKNSPIFKNIAEAAKSLVEKRDNWLNPPNANQEDLKKRTLTKLYNQRPTWLSLAHQDLDNAVLAAYGWPQGLTESEILERLLKLNLSRFG